MICARCDQGNRAIARVTSDYLNMAVCVNCVLEAIELLGPKPDQLTLIGGLPEFDTENQPDARGEKI